MPPISTSTAVNLNNTGASRASNLSVVSDSSMYTVRAGDTMTAIARSRGVSLGNLVSANPQVSNPSRIYPGQQLNIPGAPAAAPSAPAATTTEASHATRGRSDTPPSAPVENGGLSAATLRARSENQATTQPTLRQGARGSQVRDLQLQLAQKGFNPGQADGEFGRQTLAAVRGFQRAQAIPADGIVGPQTRAKLAAAPDNPVQPGGAQDPARTSGPAGVPSASASNAEKLRYASNHARQLGLTITSTTGGRHAPNSYHYSGRAIDVAGSSSKMAQFYRDLAPMRPTELFYDPIGGIKHGQNIGAIGGHSDHVHIAF